MKKLIRKMKYPRLTQWLPLTLESYDILLLKWWIDALYATKNDYQRHTGSTLSLGKGSLYYKSYKQKLNRKSSTKDEFFGLDDMMIMILLTIYLMEAQRYHITDNIMNQDNQSKMLLARNGKAYIGKRTKHIIIQYFFVTDQNANKEMSDEYFPTDDKLGDLFTKLTHG